MFWYTVLGRSVGRWFRWLPAFVLLSVHFSINAQGALTQALLQVGTHRLTVEIALTPAQREKGLMQRPHLPEQSGMLFVFDQPQAVCFWMKDTWIPLTLAFMLDDGTVSQLTHMTPYSEQAHCSRIPVRYALEVNRGWFEARRLSPGVRFTGGPFGQDR